MEETNAVAPRTRSPGRHQIGSLGPGLDRRLELARSGAGAGAVCRRYRNDLGPDSGARLRCVRHGARQAGLARLLEQGAADDSEPAFRTDRYVCRPRQRRGVLPERTAEEDLRVSAGRCGGEDPAGVGEPFGGVISIIVIAVRSEAIHRAAKQVWIASSLSLLAMAALAHHAFFNTLTKNPSVLVLRGVISQPSADSSAAAAKSSALSHSTPAVCCGGTTENSGCRAM